MAILRKPGLGGWILIAMILGALVGWIVGPPIHVLLPFGTLLIRLLKMLIVPLIFFSIAAGICSIEKFARVRRVGGLFMSYWVFSGVVCAAIGLFFVMLFKPGLGVQLEAAEYVRPEISMIDSFLSWIPTNPIGAMAEMNLIQIIVFAIIFGLCTVALSSANVEAGLWMKKGLQSGSGIMFKMVGWVLWYVPFGVFFLSADLIGTAGPYVIKTVFAMVGTQWVAYAVIITVFYGLFLWLAVGVPWWRHIRNIYPAMALAFASCSSAATMPLTMKVEKDMGIPEDSVNLVQPVAATINMHACAAEMPIYVLWAAQMYGISLTPAELMLTILLGLVMQAGVAGVPGGGIVVSAIVLQTMGLPLTPVVWIAAVYRLIDMPNTMLNNVGDTVGLTWVAKRMGELDLDKYYGRVPSVKAK